MIDNDELADKLERITEQMIEGLSWRDGDTVDNCQCNDCQSVRDLKQIIKRLRK